MNKTPADVYGLGTETAASFELLLSTLLALTDVTT